MKRTHEGTSVHGISGEEAPEDLFTVENLVKHFQVKVRGRVTFKTATVQAVDGVSFEIKDGECLSVVGESGCGKSTTARMLLRLEKPTSGAIRFRGREISELRGDLLKEYRSAVQAVMQDPWASLDPRMRVGRSLLEPVVANTDLGRAERLDLAHSALEEVGLDADVTSNFPHEFSGGQRQRISIARALALRPQAVILDEPVSALDVSVGAQIMNLLRDLQDQLGLSYLLIAHDLATVRYLSDRVLVMYLGQIVETAAADDLFSEPLHPYTQALVAAARLGGPDDPWPMPLEGDLPSPDNPPAGCRFHTRCPLAFERCAVEEPVLREVAPGRVASCHLY